MTARVSVVMTAYRAPEFIPAAIESILDQDVGACELLVVDDGSPDDIESVVAPYRGRLRYIRRDNGGPGAARDTGVDAATGDYVAFADSDDIHLPYRLSAQAALLDAHPDAALVFGDFCSLVDGERSCGSTLRDRNLGVDEEDFDTSIRAAFGSPVSASDLGLAVPTELAESRVYHGRVPALIAGRHVAWDGASMYRRASYLDVGGHDARLRYWEDWCLTSRLSKRFELVFWDAPVLLYRQHGAQITHEGGAVSAQAYRDVVFRVWKNDALFAAEHPGLLKDMVKKATLRNAHYAMQARQYGRARRDLVQFIRSSPLDRHGYTALARLLVYDKVLARLHRA